MTRAVDLHRRRPRPSSRTRSRRGPASSATRRWSAARTASTPSRPRSAPSSRSGRCRCAATASGSRAPATTIAVGKLSGAVGTYSNVDPAVERYVCEHLGLQPVPATQVLPRDRHAEVHVRVRVDRREHRVVRARDPAPAAHRGPRGRGGVPRGRAEGLERDAAQAQPDQVGAAVRPGPRAARQPAGRARRRRALARARHLALVGRAHHRPRLADARVLHAREVHARSSRACACIPSACCATSTRRSGSCSASRCCSRSSRRARRRDDAYRIVQRNAMRAWQEERSFRELLARRPRGDAPRSTPRASTRAST